ncbi:MAG TPA: SDR family oxidoreductase [Pseudonocardia sp.]|jgi:NAD(P)-dependent dehydrogenase (short-subunit alcohol dehydrogenase family)|nr:SDR family oxidoreductase [Pseudonocardia sp.]
MTLRLTGKTALVTGSTSNIGAAIAMAFAAEGAAVVVSGRDPERGKQVVAAIEADGGTAVFLRADLDGSPEASAALARGAIHALGGRIDILVNNAGIFPASTTPDTDGATFDRVFGVNVKAPFFLTQAVVANMLESGGTLESGGGVVINLGSWIARLAVPMGGVYSATKGALETLTRVWAAEFGARGIRVNAISPGVIRPSGLEPGEETPGDGLMLSAPAGAAGHPDAIAAAAVYLASDEARFTHGATLDVDGGRVNVAVAAPA